MTGATTLAGTGDLSAIALSIRVSCAAVVVMIVPGVLLATWLARTRSRCRPIVEVVTMAPLVMPPVVTGFILLIVLRSLPFDILFTWWAAVFAAAIVSVPLLIRTTRAAIEVIDPRLPHVAATLGASRLRSLRTITWPLAWKGIVGGVLLAWARALGEFGATIVVAGNIPGETRTIPLAIWTAIQSPTGRSVVPLIVAAAALSAAAIALSEWLVRRTSKGGNVVRHRR